MKKPWDASLGRTQEGEPAKETEKQQPMRKIRQYTCDLMFLRGIHSSSYACPHASIHLSRLAKQFSADFKMRCTWIQIQIVSLVWGPVELLNLVESLLPWL